MSNMNNDDNHAEEQNENVSFEESTSYKMNPVDEQSDLPNSVEEDDIECF